KKWKDKKYKNGKNKDKGYHDRDRYADEDRSYDKYAAASTISRNDDDYNGVRLDES
ncbi:MAG: hypothetical protein GY757_48210, partial [bacterium]|nr:hypothetical protein [bacterium]